MKKFIKESIDFIKLILQHGNWRAIRYFCPWRRSLRSGASPITLQIPWLTFEAIGILDSHLRTSHRVFEYGGGGSTLYFLGRTHSVFTVEHDEQWFKVLKESLENRQNINWSGKLILPTISGQSKTDKANPRHYSSDDPQYRGYDFSNYAAAIDAFPDSFFDVVLIDGRARPACIAHSLPKIKSGGLLVVDNIERKYYLSQTYPMIERSFNLLFNKIGPVPFVRIFSQTGIWRKK